MGRLVREMIVLNNCSGKWEKKSLLPFPATHFHPSVLIRSTSVTALFPLPFPSIQDLSAGDPTLELKGLLISIPKKIRARRFYEIQRLTSLPERLLLHTVPCQFRISFIFISLIIYVRNEKDLRFSPIRTS